MWIFFWSSSNRVTRQAACLYLFCLAVGRVQAQDELGLFRPKALTQRATILDLTFQPVIDFANDGCYSVAAIDQEGHLNNGQHVDEDPAKCQNVEQEDSNVYVRSRCNNGYCAWLYAYYFEKDSGTPSSTHGGGHRHSWEHVVVWVNMKTRMTEWVAVSVYGVYQDIRSSLDVVYAPGGLRPFLVYERQEGGTHAFRLTRPDERVKNHSGRYWTSPLVTYHGFPTHLVRDRLMNATWKDTNGKESFLGLNPENFGNELSKAKPAEIQNFDVNHDDSVYHVYTSAFPDNPNVAGFVPIPASISTIAKRTPTIAPVQLPLKVMVVGDSISHGADGDFTWRYRMKQWFEQDAKIPTDFVGPYHGTNCRGLPQPPKPPPFDGESTPHGPCTTGSYWRQLQFDSDHYASWGQQVKIMKRQIRETVTKYQPDLLLVMLGWNDIGWKIDDAHGTLDSMQTLVDEARQGKSTLKIALANVVNRFYVEGSDYLVANTSEYNKLLRNAIPKWSTARSPITHVDVCSEYSCSPIAGESCLAAYDGLHPDILGEWDIARAFSISLHRDFKYGSRPLAIPHELDERDVRVPEDIVVQAAPMGVKLTWTAREDARVYEVRQRRKGQGDEQWVPTLTTTNRFDSIATIPGIQEEFMIRVSGGIHRKGPWSEIYTANSGLRSVPPPKKLRTTPKDNGFDISWEPPTGHWKIDRYHILSVDEDTPGSSLVGPGVPARERSHSIRGLIPGHTYRIYMATWAYIHGELAGGLIGEASAVLVGGSTSPEPPTDLVATNVGTTSVVLTWTQKEPGRVNYKVHTESLDDIPATLTWDGTLVQNTSYTIHRLLPGTWHYRFCVSAFNGDHESGLSKCVVPEHLQDPGRA